jgi:hypothetical protein
MGNRDAIKTDARDLKIPEAGKMNEVLAALSDDGLLLFTTEMVEAVEHAQETGDLDAIQYTLNAWWVSSLFATHDRIHQAIEAAESSTDEPMTVQQVGEYLGVV